MYDEQFILDREFWIRKKEKELGIRSEHEPVFLILEITELQVLIDEGILFMLDLSKQTGTGLFDVVVWESAQKMYYLGKKIGRCL